MNAKNAANSTLGRQKRFGEQRRSTPNYGHFANPAPVSEHFNQADHSVKDVVLIRSNIDSVREARNAHGLFNKAMTTHGINRRDLN